jgi:L-malate glycosyltransferase
LKPVNNVTYLLADCTALLICSCSEGFGRVSLEALKLGVLVIAANTGGTPEIVINGMNGLLYESENIHDLSNKIYFLSNYASFNKENIAKQAGSKFNAKISYEQLQNIFI